MVQRPALSGFQVEQPTKYIDCGDSSFSSYCTPVGVISLTSSVAYLCLFPVSLVGEAYSTVTVDYFGASSFSANKMYDNDANKSTINGSTKTSPKLNPLSNSLCK